MNVLEGCQYASCIIEFSHIPWDVVLCKIHLLWLYQRFTNLQNMSVEKPSLYFVWEKVAILAFRVNLYHMAWSISQPHCHPYPFHSLHSHSHLLAYIFSSKRIFLFLCPCQLNVSLFGSTQPSIKTQLKDYTVFGIPKSSFTKTLNDYHSHGMSVSTSHESKKSCQESTMWAGNLAIFFAGFPCPVLLFLSFSLMEQGV